MSSNNLRIDFIESGKFDKEIELLREEVSKLTGRCVELTEGTMCMFCDVRCKFRSEKYSGDGSRI